MIKTPLSTVLGGAFWTPGAVQIGLSSKNLTQLIKSLFSLGEQGFAYDPNDLTTLYQDAPGTIPVTAAGQPVGLVLDKSKGLVSGEDVYISAVIGYLDSGSTSENLATGVSEKTTAWMSVNPDTFYKLESNGGIADRCRIQVKNASGVISYLTNFSGDGVAPYPRYAKTNSDSMQMRIYFKSGGGNATGLMVRQLTGNHAYQSVSASRPILQRNATTGAYYLAFDGVDDFLQTNSIDFTSTDKMSVFAGLHKLSDSAQNIFVEFSTSVNVITKSFALTTYPAGGELFTFAANGTAGLSIATARDLQFSAPVSAVLIGAVDSSTQNISLKANGVLVKSSFLGGGAFGNYPLYIGRRGGTEFPFNGHLYSLIGIGRLTTDSETLTLEKAIAKNVGVTLNV